MTPVEEALRQRAAERGRSIQMSLPAHVNGWVHYLLRRDSLAAGQLSAAAGAYHSVFIDCDGRLLQCGQDPDGDSTLRVFPSLRDVHFQSVSSSNYVSLALSEGGDVYSWGPYSFGPGAEEAYVWDINQEPQIVPGLHAICVRAIAAGAWHSAALTAEGALYTWSSWEGGLIPDGLGYEVDEDDFTVLTPRRVQGALDGVRLRCVAAGKNYTLVATQAGELFYFGNGDDGCLGHGDEESVTLPERVQALSPARGEVVTEVSAGELYAMALTTEGEVFVWGGRPADWIPRKPTALQGTRVAQISAGNIHTAAVSEAGELFTWGRDHASGCLGDGDLRSRLCPELTRVEALAGTKIASVSAGDQLTLAVAQDGSVYAFGVTTGGRLGIPQDDPEDDAQEGTPGMGEHGELCVPTKVAGLRLLQ
jgi:alpha-tubulin suppressor-like RCC1 family protein